ncbi:hypothetical protein BKA59DRAFT_528226 [Fusarium tricinctum]|uniref:F-box domain-containing protein n=1 Tax=Fusarium tricinctum TaxID=61284 RepID=A0A8K0S156_9HYPO|nr:hypothetical protein BKA59DRAFT_528226 [Fusarium tricinctum]
MQDPSEPTALEEQSNIPKKITKVVDTKENQLALEKMPIEVISHMLSFLPNTASIRAAMLSCSKLYNAYKNSQAYIASCILFNTMDESVYREVITTFNLKKKAWVGAKAGVKAVYRVYSTEERDAIHSQYLTFDQVKEMWRLHKSIDYFAHRIPTSLMRSHPVVKTKGAFSITPFVRARFQRALYRLDAFVKLLQTMIATFCDDNDGENREVVDSELKEAHWIHCLKELEEHRIIKAFHCQYSAVEIEQMSSICGLLITEIAPTFNTFIEHDIVLGAQLPYYISHPMCPGSMSLVAQGIPFLYDFMTAGSRSLRSKLMDAIKPPIDWNPRLPTRPPFPGTDEQLSCVIHDKEGEPGKWANMAVPDFIIRTPFIKDPDRGPESAWAALSHYSLFLSPQDPNTVNDFVPPQALTWGYVFWDLEMLEKAGFNGIKEEDRLVNEFVVPEDHPINLPWQPLAKYQTNEASNSLLLSCQCKNTMMDHGATGYFDYERFKADEGVEATLESDVDVPTQILLGAIGGVPTPEEMAELLLEFNLIGPNAQH